MKDDGYWIVKIENGICTDRTKVLTKADFNKRKLPVTLIFQRIINIIMPSVYDEAKKYYGEKFESMKKQDCSALIWNKDFILSYINKE